MPLDPRIAEMQNYVNGLTGIVGSALTPCDENGANLPGPVRRSLVRWIEVLGEAPARDGGYQYRCLIHLGDYENMRTLETNDDDVEQGNEHEIILTPDVEQLAVGVYVLQDHASDDDPAYHRLDANLYPAEYDTLLETT